MGDEQIQKKEQKGLYQVCVILIKLFGVWCSIVHAISEPKIAIHFSAASDWKKSLIKIWDWKTKQYENDP